MPVSGAEVRGGFEYTDFDSDSYKVLTDTNGVISASGRLMNIFNCFVKKDGYYESSEVFRWKEAYSSAELKDGKWQPWNPTIEIVLKEKKNPISLIVRNLKLDVPQLETPYGLDLEIGDWVAPYGKGETVDLLVKAKGHRNQTDFYDWSFGLDISFPNDHDGIQKFTFPLNINNNPMGSELKSENLAPESGYETAWSCLKVSRGSDTQELDGIGYYLRTRTKYDETRKVITDAVYSKVYGRIGGGMRHNNEPPFGGSPYIMFTYYMNPTSNDRNVEYDGKNNLAKEAAPPGERSNPVYSANQP
jgi:hypothetical protein